MKRKYQNTIRNLNEQMRFVFVALAARRIERVLDEQKSAARVRLLRPALIVSIKRTQITTENFHATKRAIILVNQDL